MNICCELLFLAPKADSNDSFNRALPPGLIILEDFITKDEESMLIDIIKWDKVDEQSNSVLKHRQVEHFGYEFRYDTNNVDINSPLNDKKIPKQCDFLWNRIKEKHEIFKEPPHQLTVNKYEPGQGKIKFILQNKF